MRVLLLNQFTPPAQPPTARLAGDLAEGMRAAGHEVRCIGADGSYGAVGGVRRMLRDAGAHLKIAWKVLCSGPCDWIICFSDPTGLPFTARILARLKGARLAHWAMDVYPQVAVALGAIREGFFSRCVSSAMRWGYRGCDLLVALDTDMAELIEKLSGRAVDVLPPWPPEVKPAQEQEAHAACTARVWLYSGNLGRAHDYETLIQAQHLLEKEDAGWQIHFQGGGPGCASARELALRLEVKECHWSSYAADEELLGTLLRAQVLVATQRPETRGLLWPSKLALMKHLAVPLVWVGPVEGAVAAMLRTLPVPVAVLSPGAAQELADWLKKLPPSAHAPAAISEVARAVDAERRSGVRWWLRKLSGVRV